LRRTLNWTSQRPVRQRENRDDEAIEAWVKNTFPAIVRDAVARKACLVFVDEAGFMLEPNVRRTHAPRGKTPTCRISDPHGRISAAGAIIVNLRSKQVRLAYHLLADNTNFRGESIVKFLCMVNAGSPGPMTVFWDQIPIHAGKLIDQYLVDQRAVSLAPFPPYAPELNPADGIWRYVKHARLPNHAPPDLGTLRTTLKAELNRLRRREALLKSFVRFTKLPLVV
jgi:transposase